MTTGVTRRIEVTGDQREIRRKRRVIDYAEEIGHIGMFKQGQWTDKASVATSDVALFLIAATSKFVEIAGSDVTGDVVGNIPT